MLLVKTKFLRLFPLEIQHWTAQELDFLITGRPLQLEKYSISLLMKKTRLSPKNMSLWHRNYFELKAIKKQ